jgi:hypothetical protein
MNQRIALFVGLLAGLILGTGGGYLWGTRTSASGDPRKRPESEHDGQTAKKANSVVPGGSSTGKVGSVPTHGKPRSLGRVPAAPDNVGITGKYLVKNGFKKAPGSESYSARMSLAELGKRLQVNVRSLQPVPSRPAGKPLYLLTIGDWTCMVRPVVKLDKEGRLTGDTDLRDERSPVNVHIYRRQEASKRLTGKG